MLIWHYAQNPIGQVHLSLSLAYYRQFSSCDGTSVHIFNAPPNHLLLVLIFHTPGLHNIGLLSVCLWIRIYLLDPSRLTQSLCTSRSDFFHYFRVNPRLH